MPSVLKKLLVAISAAFLVASLRCCRNAYSGTMNSPLATPSSASAMRRPRIEEPRRQQRQRRRRPSGASRAARVRARPCRPRAGRPACCPRRCPSARRVTIRPTRIVRSMQDFLAEQQQIHLEQRAQEPEVGDRPGRSATAAGRAAGASCRSTLRRTGSSANAPRRRSASDARDLAGW